MSSSRYSRPFGRFRSQAEFHFSQWLDTHSIPWLYEPEKFSLGETGYIPDFLLPVGPIYVEIKPKVFEAELYKIKLLAEHLSKIRIDPFHIWVVDMEDRKPTVFEVYQFIPPIAEWDLPSPHQWFHCVACRKPMVFHYQIFQCPHCHAHNS